MNSSLVPVVFRPVRAADRYAYVVGLILRQRREPDADPFKVKPCYFFIELLG